MNRNLVIALVLAGAALSVSGCKTDPKVAAQRFVESGDKLMTQRKYADALVEYRNAVSRDGGSGQARYKLGNAYLLNQDPVGALRELVRAADLLPDNLDVQLQAGKLLLMAGLYPEAKARAAKVVEKQPKNVEALTLMGNALAGMKELDAAIQQIGDAIEADPKQTLTYTNLAILEQSRGNTSAAESAFQRAVELDPKSPMTHLSLGNFYWASRQLEKAETELTAAWNLAPRDERTNRALAVFYLSTNKVAEGETYLKTYADVSHNISAKVVLADYYVGAGKTDQALKTLESIVATPDGFIPAKQRLAALDFMSNRRTQAYSALEEILKRDRKNEGALLQKGRFLLAEGKPQEAIPLADEAIARNPKSVGAVYLRGRAMEATHVPEKAIQAYKQVLQLQPDAPQAQIRLAHLLLTQGDANAAAEMIGTVVKNYPRLMDAHLLFARALLASGNLARAEPEVRGLARAIPGSAEVHVLEGDFFRAKKDVERAKAAYTKAAQLQPEAIDPVARLIGIDLEQNRPADAKKRLEARLGSAPDDHALLLLAGSVYSLTGDSVRAEASLKRVIQLDASNIEAYNRLAAIYIAQNRLSEAKSEYQTAASKEPKVAVAAKTMVGIILTLQNKRAEARTHYEEAIALDARAPVASNNLAWDYAENGKNLDLALQLAQTAKSGMPDRWEASDTLGWIYYKKGLAANAVTALKEATQQAPTNPTAHYHLGLAYLKDGKLGDARQSLQNALKLDPKFNEADDAKKVLSTIKSS